MKDHAITLIEDTREKPFRRDPWVFPPSISTSKGLVQIQVERAKLDTGDYSVKGMEREIAVERKAGDFCASIGRDRERFFRELERMLLIPKRLIVVEDTFAGLLMRSLINRNAFIGTYARILLMGIPIIPACNRNNARDLTLRFLIKAWQDVQEGEA